MELFTQIFIFSAMVFQLSLGKKVECPPVGVAYFPLEDCTKYLLCLNGQRSEIQCPAGLYFHPEIQNCDLPQNVPECVYGKRGVLTHCGQTMKANEGAIEYKLNEQYDAGELCVFIIRHNISSSPGFRFVLETHGISHIDRDAIKLVTFRPDKAIWMGLFYQSRVLGPPNLIPVATSEGYVAVVIFRTYSNSGTGFRLNFKGTGDPDSTPGNNNGTDYAFNNETASPISLPTRPSCTGFACLDVFAMTSESKLVIDPASYFRLSIDLNPHSFPKEFACLTSFSAEEYDRVWSLNGGCWGNETRQHVYDRRGMFFTVFVSYPEYPSTASISWEKRTRT